MRSSAEITAFSFRPGIGVIPARELTWIAGTNDVARRQSLGGAEAPRWRRSMTLLVTSAAGANGAGYGKVLAFADDGKPIGVFGDDPRIADPRGLGIEPVDRLLFVNSGSNRILALDRNGQVVRASRAIEGLNPGGGNFGPDGRYYVGLRSERTIMAFARQLDSEGEYVLPPQVVPYPRGFALAPDGTLFLASGVGPGGEGDNTILAFDSDRRMLPSWKVRDRELVPRNDVGFQKPRGLRFGPQDRLYCVTQDEVVAFFAAGKCLGAVVKLPGL